MYLKRKIDSFLTNWKEDKDRMPLIVKGARQIGKTDSILHFANSNYKNVIYINFVFDKKYQVILDDGYDAEDVVKNISLVNPKLNIEPYNTIIIFDEIQEFPDIATTLKSFKINGKYDVICSGSMLGINYKKIHSNSVGYKTDYTMYSLDFEEFLWSLGYSGSHIDDILLHMHDLTPFSRAQMDTYKRIFLEYYVLGGMPAVVKSYVINNNFSKTLEIQRQIMLDYEEDARKYAQGLDQAKIISVYRNVPSQLAKENKKFQFNKLEKNARSREYSGCVDWLIDAGLIIKCDCLLYPELPLKGNVDESKYKLYYPDTGLLVSSLDDEAQDDLRVNKNLGVYKGALYENFVAEALVKQGLGLYYYKKENSQLEEDFFVRSKSELIPLEVKSNNNQSKSLQALINNQNYSDIKHGIKLGDFNIGLANNVYTFPYFCSFLIKKYLAEWD